MSILNHDAGSPSASAPANALADSQQQRGIHKMVGDAPVPRILTPSSRTLPSQSLPSHSSDALTLAELGNPRASSSSSSLESSEAPDPAIIDALKSAKERIFVLKLGEQMEALIDEKRGTNLSFSPGTSYQRMLVHRCASYYRLQPEIESVSKTIVVSLTSESRVPAIRMAEVVPSDSSSLPAFRIMRRNAPEKSGRSRRPGSADADSDGSDGGSSLSQKKKRNLTMSEREAAYNEARSRIFSNFEDREEAVSTNSSNPSISSVPSIGDGSTASPDDDSRASEGQTTRPVLRGQTKKNSGKERWNDSSRSSTADFDPDFDRSSFNYPNVYDQNGSNAFEQPPFVVPHMPHPEEHPYGPPQYAMYPPFGPYQQPYMPPYAMYYDPRAFTYPTHPHPPQDGANVPTSPPAGPYPIYPPAMRPWYPPQPPPPPPPPPVHAMAPGPSNLNHMFHPQQSPQPLPPPGQQPPQPPFFNPVAPTFYPQPQPPHPPVPHQNAHSPFPNHTHPPFMPPPVQPQQSHPPTPSRINNPLQSPPFGSPIHVGANQPYSPPDDAKSVGSSSSRLNSSSRTSSRGNVRETLGTAATRMRAPLNNSSPRARDSQLPRTPWGSGAGGSGLGIPMALNQNGRKAGSAGSRAGSVSSRAGSTNGAMTPGDETRSIASSETSSSSSRKTFTSNSSRHPLPARPDWAVGLPRSGSNHSRRSSGSSSALQSVSSDFPSLSDRSPASVVPNMPALNSNEPLISNGVWKPGNSSGQISAHVARSQSGDMGSPIRTLGSIGSNTSLSSMAVSPVSISPTRPTMLSHSSRSSGSSLPPPAPSLPPPPHRAYEHYAQQQQHGARLTEHDASFKRPTPKSTLGDGSPGSDISNPAVSAAVFGDAPHTSTSGSSCSKSPEEEQNDRARGEAVASAILADKFSNLQLSPTTAGLGVVNEPSSYGDDVFGGSSASNDPLASRRPTITQASNLAASTAVATETLG